MKAKDGEETKEVYVLLRCGFKQINQRVACAKKAWYGDLGSLDLREDHLSAGGRNRNPARCCLWTGT